VAIAEEAAAAPVADPAVDAEAVVRQLFALISRGNPGGAANLMTESRDAWKDGFSALEKARIASLEPWEKDAWAEGQAVFMVSLQISCAPEDEENPKPFPCGGWSEGANTRWVRAVLRGDNWKISDLATGP